MEAETTQAIEALAVAAREGDTQGFLRARDALKAQVCRTLPGQSIGPGLAFGTLAPAGDAAGAALLEGELDKSLAIVDIMISDATPEVKCVACRCVGHLGRRYPDEIVAPARRLANDESWEVREFIANALDEIMSREQGEFLFALMEEWVSDAEANIRRVPTNALMRFGRRHPQRVIDLMGRLLHDDSNYVRDNVVFCLGVMGAVKVPMIGPAPSPLNPDILLATLRCWLADDDVRARWIIAKTLGRSWTKARPEQALALLRELAQDGRKPVRNAVIASVKAIAKSHSAIAQDAVTGWTADANPEVQAAARALQSVLPATLHS